MFILKNESQLCADCGKRIEVGCRVEVVNYDTGDDSVGISESVDYICLECLDDARSYALGMDRIEEV